MFLSSFRPGAANAAAATTSASARRAAGATAGIVALSLGLTACDPSEIPAPEITEVSEIAVPEQTSSETAAPQTTSTVAPAPEAQDAQVNAQFVEDSLQKSMVSLEEPDAKLDLTEILTGAALEARENQRQELETNAWRQEGEPKVVHSEILPGNTPESMSARICVDSSEIKVFDENNVPVNADIPAEEQRSLMIATYEKVDGSWKISDLTFPDDPRC